MAEQNFNQAIKVADRAYVMVYGRVEFEGKSAAGLQDNR
jgi:ABC-type branched-subunit amino acid transport system ATPase component